MTYYPEENAAHVVQETSEFNVIFIHSELDDAGLTANEFRIYAHLARRANKQGKGWPGIDSMAKVCKMHKETVVTSLQELERRKMILVERTMGKKNIYRLTNHSFWAPVGNGERSDQSEMGNGPVGNGERHQSEMGNVSISSKGNPKRKSKEAASGFTVPACFEKIDGFSAALAGWIESRKKSRKPPTGLAIQLVINRLAEKPTRAVEALHAAIERGWLTVKWEWLDNHENKTTPTNRDSRSTRNIGPNAGLDYSQRPAKTTPRIDGKTAGDQRSIS